MTDPLADAFPTRPLRLRLPLPSRLRAWGVATLIAAFFLAIGGVIAATTLPDLLEDHRLRDRAVPFAKARVESGRCTVRLALFHDCRVTLRLGEARIERSFAYTAFEPGGTLRLRAMGDPARPDTATTDVALDRLPNRALTLAGFLGAMLLLVIGALATPALRARAARMAAQLDDRPLHPEPAQVKLVEGQWITRPAGGGPPTAWPFRGKHRPFLVDPAGGIALAVTAPGAPLLPLDEGLTFLDLSEAERDAIRRAARAVSPAGFPPPGSAPPSAPAAP